MGKAAFLAWAAGREQRYELAEGQVVMMTGGSRAHAQIIANLVRALGSRLDLDKWMILSDFGIEIGAETVRSPDIVVDPLSDATRDLTASTPTFNRRGAIAVHRTNRSRRQSCRVFALAESFRLSGVGAGRNEGLGLAARQQRRPTRRTAGGHGTGERSDRRTGS
jgi:hypothetical protein